MRSELEHESATLWARLQETDEKLTQTQAARDVERQEFQQELERARAERQDRTPIELQSFIDRSREAARKYGVRGDHTRHLPLAQIRLKGPSPSWCHNEPTLLAQYSSGGFVMQKCPVCGEKETLRAADFLQMDVWISCAECGSRMVPKTLALSNYGFACEQCGWECLLASLLPAWHEVQPTGESSSAPDESE